MRFSEFQEHLDKLLRAIAQEEEVEITGFSDVLAFAVALARAQPVGAMARHISRSVMRLLEFAKSTRLAYAGSFLASRTALRAPQHTISSFWVSRKSRWPGYFTRPRDDGEVVCE